MARNLWLIGAYRGLRLDVWTLNAETPNWRQRLARALAADVDIITTDTPRALAATNNDPKA